MSLVVGSALESFILEGGLSLGEGATGAEVGGGVWGTMSLDISVELLSLGQGECVKPVRKGDCGMTTLCGERRSVGSEGWVTSFLTKIGNGAGIATAAAAAEECWGESGAANEKAMDKCWGERGAAKAAAAAAVFVNLRLFLVSRILLSSASTSGMRF